MDFRDFIVQTTNRPMPNNTMARIRLLAREIAEGASEGIWKPNFETSRTERIEDIAKYIMDELRWLIRNSDEVGDKYPIEQAEHALLLLTQRNNRQAFRRLLAYLFARWKMNLPDLHLLQNMEYITFSKNHMQINRLAFDLIEEVDSATIFISYKRSESSAFALLLLSRLKYQGLEPFVDMAIEPGNNWFEFLREQVYRSDYFIMLLAPSTLQAHVPIQEIAWAIESNSTIIPIWHNGFQYETGRYDIPEDIDQMLSEIHTIRVVEESAHGYNNAIIELLNRFGITP